MSLLPSRMQFADVDDFKPLGKPLRHREERDARLGAAIAKMKLLGDFEDEDHGAADGGCMQERLPNMLANEVAVKSAYVQALNSVNKAVMSGFADIFAGSVNREYDSLLCSQLKDLVTLRSGRGNASKNFGLLA